MINERDMFINGCETHGTSIIILSKNRICYEINQHETHP